MDPPRTQRDLAAHLEMDAGNLSKILRGKVKLTVEDATRIAAFVQSDVLAVIRAAMASGGGVDEASEELVRQSGVTFGDNAAGIVGQDRETHLGSEELDVVDGAGAVARLLAYDHQPERIGTEEPPDEARDAIGIDGFGVKVRGNSMAGYFPPILSEDTVWIDGEQNWSVVGAVVAIVRDAEDAPPKMVVKHYDGEHLWSYPPEGQRERLEVYCIDAISPVIAASTPDRIFRR